MLGRSHARIRELRELRRNRRKRDEAGVFFAEGVHLAEEALASGAALRLALVSPALDRHPAGPGLRRGLTATGTEILETTAAALDSLQDARSPQPVLLVVRRRPDDLEAVLDARPGVPLVVGACGLQDPGNLGSILRTAEAAGATALVAAGEGADLFHPKTVRATMGSIFRLPAARAAVEPALDALHRRGIRVVAADPHAGPSCFECDLTGPVAVLIGREADGLAGHPLRAAARRVRIPMATGVESLSAGAAAAVLLYEAARQRAG